MRFLAFAALALGLGCTPVTIPLDPPGAVDATVEFLQVEGGCWSIKTAEDVFQPINLAQEFRQDGLRVRVSFKQRNDMGSVCMIGPLVEILSIRTR